MRLIFSLLLSLFILFSVDAQFTISGKITNDQGEALIAASVFLRNSNYASATDESGNFIIDNVEQGYYEMKVTSIGYKSFSEFIDIDDDLNKNIVLSGNIFNLDKIEINASRLDDKDPFTYTDYSEEEIDIQEGVADLPILLRYAAGVVSSSDAGAGVGYTGLRVRGSDPTRVNITINGVPLNDSESHGVFWVNMPDFSSNISSLQIHRGVGTSTNGTGSLGANININTLDLKQNPYALVSLAGGSFGTYKTSVSFGTGLMNDHYSVEGRYSLINSDGYIDRSAADLKSWYFGAAKVTADHSIRLNIFSGHEITNQAWYGVPQSKVDGDQDGLLTHYNNNLGVLYNTTADSINLFDSGRNYNYYLYPDQVDNYRQTHVQLQVAKEFSENLSSSTTLHYTRGRGFFEEFRYQDDLINYGVENLVSTEGDTISTADLVRRRWLDNHFYGFLSNLQWDNQENTRWTLGLAANRYIGDHFGELIGLVDPSIDNVFNQYYFSDATKDDANVFLKLDQKFGDKLSIFAEAQYRYINYTSVGNDNDGVAIDIDEQFNFFNPKIGLGYELGAKNYLYASYAIANKEPIRSDFIDAFPGVEPKPESLQDFEVGIRHTSEQVALQANIYHMQYTDQLIATGALNDVGAIVRSNVPDSYRQGIEFEGVIKLTDQFSISPNFAYSRNKISTFTEVLEDYTNGFELVNNDYEDTNIAFSPSIVAGNIIQYKPLNYLEFNLLSKYVGKQYLDNTSNDERSLDPYFISDLSIVSSLETYFAKEVKIKLLVNNIFNTKYSATGYTYSYIFGDLITENFEYPQAGTHLNLVLDILF